MKVYLAVLAVLVCVGVVFPCVHDSDCHCSYGELKMCLHGSCFCHTVGKRQLYVSTTVKVPCHMASECTWFCATMDHSGGYPTCSDATADKRGHCECI